MRATTPNPDPRRPARALAALRLAPALLLALLPSCIFAIDATDDGHHRVRSMDWEEFEDWGDERFDGRSGDAPAGDAIAVIEAASTITFSEDRLAALADVARGFELSEREQLVLIDAIYAGGFSANQADALVAVVEHQALTPRARSMLSQRLVELSFSSDRERVVAALTAGGPAPAPEG